MTKFVTVKVTAEHIAKGKPKQPKLCPVAKACRAAGLTNVSVSQIWLDYGRKNARACVPTPKAAANFINKFDTGNPVKPFTFRVRVNA